MTHRSSDLMSHHTCDWRRVGAWRRDHKTLASRLGPFEHLIQKIKFFIFHRIGMKVTVMDFWHSPDFKEVGFTFRKLISCVILLIIARIMSCLVLSRRSDEKCGTWDFHFLMASVRYLCFLSCESHKTQWSMKSEVWNSPTSLNKIYSPDTEIINLTGNNCTSLKFRWKSSLSSW